MSVFQTSIHEKPIASQKDKERKDFERIKEIVEGILLVDRGPDEMLKMQINLELLNGSLDPELYEDPFCFDIKNEDGSFEKLSFDHQNISHTPWISIYANAYIGEQVPKKLASGICDNRTNRNTLYKQQLNAPLEKYFSGLVQSVNQSAVQQAVQSAGESIQDPKVQQQIQAQIQQSIEKQIPKDILDFLNGTYQAPLPRLAHELLKYHIKRDDINYERLQGFKYGVAHDEEIYFAGDWNGKLEFRAENPMNIVWGCGARTKERIEDADWIKRTDYISLTQAMSRHADTLTKSDIKELEEGFQNFKSGGSTPPFWGDNTRTKELMTKFSEMSEGEREYYSQYDRNSPEGEKRFMEMYSRLMGHKRWGSKYSECGIKEDHICVRLPMKMYRIEREDERGKRYFVEVMDHYEPVHTDIDVTEIRREVIYECYVLNDEIFTGIRPLPCQYVSPDNYREPKMPYYGQRYSTHQNRARSKSMIDKAKSPQKMYDTTLASIKKDLATDIGTVFMMFSNLKPKDWKTQDWLDFMVNAGIMWIDPKNRAMNGVDPQFLREINLSKMGGIAAKVQMLDYWKRTIAMSMFFSEERAEAVGQYASKENIAASNQRIFSKTAMREETHRMIVERALTGYINRARYFYKKRPQQAATFLDDVQLALLESQPLSSFEYLGVEVDNTTDQLEKLNKIQSVGLTLIQNQFDPETALKIICSDDVNEIMDLAKQATKLFNERRQEDFSQQEMLTKLKLQSDAQDKEAERKLEYIMHSEDLASKERRSAVEAQKWRLANDVDQNRVSDLLEGTLTKIQAQREMHKDKMDLDKQKLELMEKLGQRPRI